MVLRELRDPAGTGDREEDLQPAGAEPVVGGPGGYGERGRSEKEAVVPEFPSVTHVALTVTDLGRSRPWYQKLFGTQPVIDEDTGPFHHVVWLLGSQTLVGIHQFPDPHGSEPFDERQPGLDHLAFACANRAELGQWESKLNELGVENGGIVDASYGSGLSFRDPDNIALEFFAPPG
jgi:glyoxylase I family protein